MSNGNRTTVLETLTKLSIAIHLLHIDGHLEYHPVKTCLNKICADLRHAINLIEADI